MLQLHFKTNQAYLITAGFLHEHSYERKHFAVLSVNRIIFRGLRPLSALPLDPLGAQPQTPTAAPTSLPEIFLALYVKSVVHPWPT